ncbi:hypothetical protein X777_02433, partial [Ooceraea biroi]
TEAGCKPLNNSSRGDRWVACRSFLLARPIKARGSNSRAHGAPTEIENTDWTEKGIAGEVSRERESEELGPRDLARSVDLIGDVLVESIVESISHKVSTGQGATTLTMRSRLARVGLPVFG